MRSAALFAAALLPSAALAFAPSSSISSSSATTARRSSAPLHATIASSELATMSKEEQLNALGVEEEKLALGIDPDEVLEFVGTRDDLVAKFSADIPKFSPSEVEAEVDKFLMDGEMLDVFIKYNQRKAEDPDWEPIYAPEPSPFVKAVNFASQYAIWFVGAFLLKDVVSNYLNKDGGGGEAAETLVSSVADGVHHLSNTLA